MAFSLKTIAFVLLIVAVTVACISASDRMTRDRNLVSLPRIVMFTFAYLVLLISITHIIFDKPANRAYFTGVSIVLLGYFVTNLLGVNCNIPTGAWLEIFKSNDIRAASDAAEIASVGGWVLLSLAIGIYSQWLTRRAKDAR